MRSLFLALSIVALGWPVQAAPKVKTPYEAVVEDDEVTVRGGPGTTQFYPTSKLRRGDKVMVYRHDPGDWYMIAPPPGSFSWVPAKYIRKTDDEHGLVTTDKVAVRIGSQESDIHAVFQRVLAKDDEVQILGEKMLKEETEGGRTELWYRIAPPPNEWRWIRGQSVIPSTGLSRPRESDPFVAPIGDNRSGRRSPRAPHAEDESPTFESPQLETPVREYSTQDSGFGAQPEPAKDNRPLVRKGGKPSKSPPVTRKQDDLNTELDRLDARFQAIIDGPILDWDFDQLERDYIGLRSESEKSGLVRVIDSRLDRIANYRKVQGEEREVAQIQDETTRRDQELAELQRKQEALLVGTRQSQQYDGAGVVARAALNRRGAPRYALLNQKGRVLAYLYPAQGIDLEKWVGKGVGVIGPRFPNSEYRADVITVNRIAPVRLQPQ